MAMDGLPSPSKLTKLLVAKMISFLFLSGPLVQLDHCWLPLRCGCHFSHIYGYLVNLVVVRVRKGFDWVGLFNCFIPLTACTVFPGTMEDRLQERGFQNRSM